jgi:hypothetical protein
MFEIYFLPHCSVENTSNSAAFMFSQAVNTNYIIYTQNSTVSNKGPNSIQRNSNKAKCNVVAYFQQAAHTASEAAGGTLYHITSALDGLDSQFHAPAALPLETPAPIPDVHEPVGPRTSGKNVCAPFRFPDGMTQAFCPLNFSE